MNASLPDMRIAVLAPYAIFPADAGGKHDIRLLSKALSGHAFIVMLSVPQPPSPDFETVPLLGASRLRYANPFLIFRISRFIRKNKISHLLMVHPYLGWLALSVRALTGVKLIVRSQNIEAERFRSFGKWWWRIMHFYEGFVHRKADLNLWITQEDMSYAREKYYVQPAQSMWVPYGTERTRVVTAGEKLAASEKLRARHVIHNDETILLFNGSFRYRPNIKAFDFLVDELVPELAKSDRAFRLLIFGGGLDPDRVTRITKQPQITYAGFVDDPETYYAGADIFLNPVVEGGGIKTKLIDAIAAGLPTVSFDSARAGVSDEIISKAHAVVPDNDLQGFVAAIKDLLRKGNDELHFFPSYAWKTIAANLSKRLIKMRSA